MGRFLKFALILVAGLAGILVIAAVSLVLFFDPNDFRDRIASAVKESTGRDLVVGDIDLKVFPWLAVELGPTSLGNADGFSADSFLSFESASLSVRIMPLILRQDIAVGTASLDGLTINLEVLDNGTSNWDDLAEGGDDDNQAEGDGERSDATFDVANIQVTGANVAYADAAAGSTFAINNFSFQTGRIAADTPFGLEAEFDFASTPGDLAGQVAMRATMTIAEGVAQISMQDLNVSGSADGVIDGPADFNFDARQFQVDTVTQTFDPGEMDLMVLGVAIAANVEPFSYSESPRPVAEVSVPEFSLKTLMQTLGIEPPQTVDPGAMSRVAFSARAAVTESDLQFSSMTMSLDDSAMTGSLSLPLASDGAIGFDLEVDSIALDGYMAPAAGDEAPTDSSSADVEIPAELIRALNVDGEFRIVRATLTGMEFSNLTVGVSASDGRLRLNPLSADFYDGGYNGDVRIDVSGSSPALSLNERIENVSVGALMRDLFEVDDVTGTFNGQFELSGSGQTVSAIQQDLDGTMSIELADGAWEGTDVWHKLRSARALYRQEPVPEPTLPARTEFTSVTATGVVIDGVFTNDDFLAELPFLQLTGGGQVNITSNEVDYTMQVRVLDRPEFMAGATAEELEDFTETVVPVKITGLLSAPDVRPDIEGIFRARVEETIEEKKDELRDELLNRLLGSPEPEEGDPDAVPEEEEDPEEKLKRDLLKKLFEN